MFYTYIVMLLRMKLMIVLRNGDRRIEEIISHKPRNQLGLTAGNLAKIYQGAILVIVSTANNF